MKVILEAALFEPSRSDTLHLLGLLQLGYEGRHLLSTDPLEDGRVTQWLANRSRDESHSCQLAFEAGLREQSRLQSAGCVRVKPGTFRPHVEGRELTLCLSDALVFLRSAFQVLLEDNERDKSFVLAVAKVEWRERLMEMEKKGWLCFLHGGGITRMLETVGNASGDPCSGFRLWVLFDSDSLAPGKPSAQATRLANRCGQKIAFHCLERRAVENYIPVLALKHWALRDANDHRRGPDMRRAVHAFCSMTLACRSHYNLKHGFQGDSQRDDRDNVGTLYDRLEPSTRQALDHGFGADIAGVFAWYNWPDWESWMNAGREREEGGRLIQSLFSKL
jgi:hypothetical protein